MTNKKGEEEIQYLPIRQNFREMLNVPGTIPVQHLEAMTGIRNAFCHNHYVEDLAFGTIQSADIPEIANAIVEDLAFETIQLPDIPEIANAIEKVFKELVKKHSK